MLAAQVAAYCPEVDAACAEDAAGLGFLHCCGELQDKGRETAGATAADTYLQSVLCALLHVSPCSDCVSAHFEVTQILNHCSISCWRSEVQMLDTNGTVMEARRINSCLA